MDMERAETHPSSLDRPEEGAPKLAWVMHGMHKAILAGGRRAGRNYNRKIPQWPIAEASQNSVLGYGAEKIVYRIQSKESEHVLSIYHRESLRNEPLEVIRNKQDKYNTYRRYFGELIVPTQFMVVDNPWGKGGKPATLQPFVENMEELGPTTVEQLKMRAEKDGAFAQSLGQLVTGYRAMTQDGLYPDFASSNVMVSGSDITIVDTGMMYDSNRAEHLRALHPNYQVLEAL